MPESRTEAFERAFRADHAALLAFFFRRVDDYELSRDLAAETYRIAWTRWEEPRQSDRAWLFGIARNLIGNEYRRRTSRPTATRIEDIEVPDVNAESRLNAVEIRAALSTLESKHQEVLRLTYWDGLSALEVANLLATTPAAVWVRLFRARRAFSRAWQDQTSPLSILPTRTEP